MFKNKLSVNDRRVLQGYETVENKGQTFKFFSFFNDFIVELKFIEIIDHSQSFYAKNYKNWCYLKKFKLKFKYGNS